MKYNLGKTGGELQIILYLAHKGLWTQHDSLHSSLKSNQELGCITSHVGAETFFHREAKTDDQTNHCADYVETCCTTSEGGIARHTLDEMWAHVADVGIFSFQHLPRIRAPLYVTFTQRLMTWLANPQQNVLGKLVLLRWFRPRGAWFPALTACRGMSY